MKEIKQKSKIGKWSPSNISFSIFNYVLLTFLTLLCLYPMLHVLFASVSDPTKLIAHQGVLLKPLGFTLSGYRLVFQDNSILIGFKNTFLYVGIGTFLNMALTIMGAYTLSRRDYPVGRYPDTACKHDHRHGARLPPWVFQHVPAHIYLFRHLAEYRLGFHHISVRNELH